MCILPPAHHLPSSLPLLEPERTRLQGWEPKALSRAAAYGGMPCFTPLPPCNSDRSRSGPWTGEMQAPPPAPWRSWPFSSPRGLGLRQEGSQSMLGRGNVCLAPSTAPPGTELSWGRASSRKSPAESAGQHGGPESVPGRA